jgi:hypothetical protein
MKKGKAYSALQRAGADQPLDCGVLLCVRRHQRAGVLFPVLQLVDEHFRYAAAGAHSAPLCRRDYVCGFPADVPALLEAQSDQSRGRSSGPKTSIKSTMNEEVGDTGRYNFGQKCVFWAAIISLVLLLASGVMIWRPYFAPSFPIPLIRLALLVHSLAAVGLIIVIMVHIYAALWVKGTITAMVEGWVPAAWAKKHHPRWYREVREKQQEDKP